MPHISEINAWAHEIQKNLQAYQDANFNYPCKIKIEVSYGAKNAKIIRSENGGHHRSVYCFVDRETGDILKAASWKAPAKHPRGNIADENGGWGKAVGPYGAAYLR